MLNTGLVCASFLVAVLIGAYTYKNRNRSNDVISVTGLAKQDFDSDLVTWSGRYSRRNPELKKAYELLRADLSSVTEFLKVKKIDPDEMTVSSISIEKEYEDVRDPQGNFTKRFKGFLLTQHVRVESKTIDKVETLARDITDLIDKGIEFYSDQPQYYYTKLGELKIEMIAAATRDGRVRAEKISENARGKIGSLRYSSLGVFQITRPNSSAESSWEGTFDTASRKKTAAITIKLQFGML